MANNSNNTVSVSTTSNVLTFSGQNIITSVNDNTVKPLVTYAQSGTWQIDLRGIGSEWQQRIRVTSTKQYTASGSETVTNINSDVSSGRSLLTANRVDSIFWQDVTVADMGFATYSQQFVAGNVLCWANDNTTKIEIRWWGHEYTNRIVRWHVTVTNL